MVACQNFLLFLAHPVLQHLSFFTDPVVNNAFETKLSNLAASNCGGSLDMFKMVMWPAGIMPYEFETKCYMKPGEGVAPSASPSTIANQICKVFNFPDLVRTIGQNIKNSIPTFYEIPRFSALK